MGAPFFLVIVLQCPSFHSLALASLDVSNHLQRTEKAHNDIPDGSQFMKYTYDIFTQLRSSIDMPKECATFLLLLSL
jgi:hypothetical protein